MTRTRARLLGAATTVSLLAAGLVGVAGPASAAVPPECTQESTHKVTCTYSSSFTLFTVPARVTALDVEVEGARGGKGSYSVGGMGALVTGRLTGLVPGTDLFVVVGSAGVSGNGTMDGGGGGGGGYNGGGGANTPYSYAGGGGGASDIRVAAPEGSRASRLVVAAGGGGGGYYTDGGTASAADGTAGQTDLLGQGGQGATTSHGGVAVRGQSKAPATDGELGKGGSGNAENSFTRGGGGGGGFYGGGGGYDGGGGSGSSLVPTGGTVAASTTETPHVTISYDPDRPVAAPPAPGPLGLASAGVPHLRGHMMSIDVTGFTPGETYRVKISGVVVGHGTADAKGEIHRKVRVPLRAHRPKAKLVVKGSQHRVHQLIRIRDGIAKP